MLNINVKYGFIKIWFGLAGQYYKISKKRKKYNSGNHE